MLFFEGAIVQVFLILYVMNKVITILKILIVIWQNYHFFFLLNEKGERKKSKKTLEIGLYLNLKFSVVEETVKSSEKKFIKHKFDCHGKNMTNENLEALLMSPIQSVILNTKCLPSNHQ